MGNEIYFKRLSTFFLKENLSTKWGKTRKITTPRRRVSKKLLLSLNIFNSYFCSLFSKWGTFNIHCWYVSYYCILQVRQDFRLLLFCLHWRFFSPYWVKSFDETFSEFKNMGLWEYCFEQFRYPYYQFPHLFDGCHHVFSQEFYVIREWLLPPWLMAVQAFVTISLLLSFGSQVVMAMQLCRWPLEFVLRYEWILSAVNFISITITSKCNTSILRLVF